MAMALSSFIKKNLARILTVVALFGGAGVAGYQMLRLPLWGWWPLLLLLAGWMGIIMMFLPSSPVGKKWLGASTLSGVLLGIGFPPSPFTWVVFFAWVPWLAVENGIYQQQDRIQPRKVFWYTFHACVLWNIIATFWVTNTAFIAGIMANFVNAAFMATVMMLFHIVRYKLPRAWWIGVLIAFWISFEYLHHVWDLSWPWLSLGNALAEYPWAIQWYEWTGAFGGSLWIWIVNFLVYDIITRWLRARPLSAWRLPVAVILPIAVSLAILFSIKESSHEPVEVTIVQPNYEPHYQKFDVPQHEQTRRFFQLTMDNIDSTTDYLVFPETSFEGIRLNTITENPVIRLFQSVVDSFPHLHLVSGISSFRVLEKNQLEGAAYRTHVTPEGDTILYDIQNAAIQMSAADTIPQVYFKSKLVPGPEMLPFKEVLFFLEPIVDKLGGSYEGHTKQKEREVFTGGPLRVAPVICYESVYGEYVGEYVRKGATALFIVTNDGWWDRTPGHIQHLKIGALRAIEHRRPIARSANTGISCFIDIRGHVRQPTQYDQPVAVRGRLIPESRMTLYTRIGDVMAVACVIAAIGFLLWSLIRSFVPPGRAQ